MSRFLLDSDTCVWALRNDAAVVARLRAQSPEDIAVSTITEAELRYGCLGARDPARELKTVAAFLASGITILAFDRAAAVQHARLRHALRANPIGERDLMIASIAVAAKLVVVTSNRREFARVPGLSVADWRLQDV